MGAHGALQLSFNYPEVFGIAGAHSPSLREDDGVLPILGTGDDYTRSDPISLAATASPAGERLIWIDVGAEDSWLPRAQLLHETLSARGIAHEWHVLPGDHDGEYWRRNLLIYLRFYDRALNDGRLG